MYLWSISQLSNTRESHRVLPEELAVERSLWLSWCLPQLGRRWAALWPRTLSFHPSAKETWQSKHTAQDKELRRQGGGGCSSVPTIKPG